MGKRVAILGAGESGIGAAILAKQKGLQVFVSDGGTISQSFKEELQKHEIDFEELQHTTANIFNADEIVKSPGIPETNALIQEIRARGISIISEIEFAYRFIGNSKVLGITGSNGKTTTTSLLFHICRHAGLNCSLVGNIGYSFARQVAENPTSFYVAEISSFQLDDIQTFRPHVAILTNITEDHLDRYNYNVENYISSKFRIAMNQAAGDFFIYCADDPTTIKYLDRHPIQSHLLPFTMQDEINEGAFIKDHQMTITAGDETVSMSIYDFQLRGKHNQYNTMAAGIGAAAIGIRKEVIRDAIQSFEGLEHRMEYVTMVRGVEFINDSKSTNVNSVWYALESMEKPVVLILGGVDKGNDYSTLLDLVKEKVKAIICLGTDNRKLHEAFDNEVGLVKDTQSAQQAVKAAFDAAEVGDVVLLSPACASFDLFKNYEDRGRQFKEAVMTL